MVLAGCSLVKGTTDRYGFSIKMGPVDEVSGIRLLRALRVLHVVATCQGSKYVHPMH